MLPHKLPGTASASALAPSSYGKPRKQDAILRPVLREHGYKRPNGSPSPVVLRRISSAPITPSASVQDSQYGQGSGSEGSMEVRIRIGEVSVKKPVIVRTPPPGHENFARFQAHPVTAIEKLHYRSLPRPREIRPCGVLSPSHLESGYSRYPPPLSGCPNSYRRQQRALISSLTRVSKRWTIRRASSPIDVVSLYSRDQDIELAYVDDGFSSADTLPLYMSQGDIENDLHNRNLSLRVDVGLRHGIWHGFKCNRQGMRTIFCLITIAAGAVCLLIVLPVVRYMTSSKKRNVLRHVIGDTHI